MFIILTLSFSLAQIINMARSPNATVYIYLKFSTGVPYERVQIFEKALTQFVKARPREWVGLLGFRATQVMAELGYIEYVVVALHVSCCLLCYYPIGCSFLYVIVLTLYVLLSLQQQQQKREAWQNVTTILVSKAQVASFCLELSKKLNMRYRSPPLPVDLAMVKSNRGSDDAADHQSTKSMEGTSWDDSAGMQELVALFESKKDK